MSVYDDLLKTQHLIEARGNALADELITVLENSRSQVVGKLAELQAKYLTGVAWDAESFTRRKAFLEAQRAEIDRLIGEVYANMARPTLEAAQDAMSYTTAATGRSFASIAAPGLTIGEGATVLSLATVAAWAEVHTIEGLVLTEWLAAMSKNSANRIVAAGREAMIQGLSVPNTARLLRIKGIEGGVQALESLARTYLLSASNYANEQVFERNKDIIGKLRYSAVLDGRTCLICGNDDGRLFKMDEPRPSLQRHINCRCLYLPVTDWESIGIPELAQSETERPAVKHDERTVHHRDGTTGTRFKVADVEHTGENYNAWITRQLQEDPAFARRVLGKTRFELLEKGEITLEKMVVDGRIRRLSELTAMPDSGAAASRGNLAALLGKEYTGVSGQAAIDLLLREQSGHVREAFYRVDIGSIDLLWGDDSFGLQHIIKRRTEEGQNPKKLLLELGRVIENGIVFDGKSGGWEVQHGGKKAVIYPELHGSQMNYILTAFTTGRKK